MFYPQIDGTASETTAENEQNSLCLNPFINSSRVTGQARYRFGAKIPLLAIVSWGSTAHTNVLAVEENSVNYGYMTKEPVEYSHTPIERRALLDPNHSHFILVSDF